ncbi:hypothetical protein ACF0H5_006706 [Mactra antiquata]
MCITNISVFFATLFEKKLRKIIWKKILTSVADDTNRTSYYWTSAPTKNTDIRRQSKDLIDNNDTLF